MHECLYILDVRSHTRTLVFLVSILFSYQARTHAHALPVDDANFGVTALDAEVWSVLNPSRADISVADGSLIITPNSHEKDAIWRDNDSGVLVYQEMSGNFDVRTWLRTTSTLNIKDLPLDSYGTGGLLVRDPDSMDGSQNSVQIAVRSAVAVGEAAGISIESISTVNSVSDRRVIDAAPPYACDVIELRVVRVYEPPISIGLEGRSVSTFEVHWRPTSAAAHASSLMGPGDENWHFFHGFTREDFPEVVHVGLMDGSYAGPHKKLPVMYDGVAFVRASDHKRFPTRSDDTSDAPSTNVPKSMNPTSYWGVVVHHLEEHPWSTAFWTIFMIGGSVLFMLLTSE